MIWRVLDNILCELGQGHHIYFFVNACPPEPLDIATSNFTGA